MIVCEFVWGSWLCYWLCLNCWLFWLVIVVGYCWTFCLFVCYWCLFIVIVYLLLGLCVDSVAVDEVWFVLFGVGIGCACCNSVAALFIFVVSWLLGEDVCLISMPCCLLIVLWVCFACSGYWFGWFCLLIVFLWFCCSELIVLIDSLGCVLLWVTIWIWLCLSVMLLVMVLFRFLLLVVFRLFGLVLVVCLLACLVSWVLRMLLFFGLFWMFVLVSFIAFDSVELIVWMFGCCFVGVLC